MLRLTPEDANAISEIECLLTLRETGRELVLGTDNKLTRKRRPSSSWEPAASCATASWTGM